MTLRFLRCTAALCLAACGALPLRAYILELSDPNALPVAQNVYSFLASRNGSPTNRMVEGQHLGGVNEALHPEIYGSLDITTHAVDGRLPGMAGARYDGNDKQSKTYILDAHVDSLINANLISTWNQYQPIIHLTAVPPNPWNPQSGREPFSPSNNIGDLLLSAPDSPAKRSFWASIDIIAAGLKELQDAGVPVLFRPFAEFNQTDKYYFLNQTPANFVQLWRDVYGYYVGQKGLHNLIFCWEVWALNRTPYQADIAPWYPGDGYVDVVAGAYYFLASQTYINAAGVFSFPLATDSSIYAYLTSCNRPFGAAQWGLNQKGVGPGDDNFTLAFMNFSPQLAFAYYWTDVQAVEVQANASAFVAEPRVATADDLPGFSVKTYTSVPAEDGWIRETFDQKQIGAVARSDETGPAALRTGTMGAPYLGTHYKSIVSFDTSTISPASVITNVTLRLRRGSLTGRDPFLAGALRADVSGPAGFGGSLTLTKEDYEYMRGVSVRVIQMSAPAGDGDWSSGVMAPTSLNTINRTGHTQFRLSFDADSRLDLRGSTIGWYSGEADPDSRPQLIVTYKYQ